MTKKRKYALAALVCYIISLIFFTYWIIVLGVFDKNKIVIKNLFTTGPDYEIISGQMKMAMQIPSPISKESLWGIMVADGRDKIDAYIDKDWTARWDYFVISVEVIGAKQSDGSSYHPLVKVYDCIKIDCVIFFGEVILGTMLFLLFVIFSIKFSSLKSE